MNVRMIATVFIAAYTLLGIGSLGAGSTSSAAVQSSKVNLVAATPTPGRLPGLTTVPKAASDKGPKGFIGNLPADFSQPTDEAGRLLLREYGSVFVARGGATPPKKVVFEDAADVDAFQMSIEHSSATIGGFTVELQTAALTALRSAIADARRQNLSIEPRGANSSSRGYEETVKLWASRVDPGFVYWIGRKRVTRAEALRIKALSPYEQVPEILNLESQGIYFAKSLDKSIIYSVAPPGTSQHLSMLALDVKQFDDARVRAILATHGWFQTVKSDLPHFTYLGVSESELPGLGLKSVQDGNRVFWIADL